MIEAARDELLSIEKLSLDFRTYDGVYQVLDDVSLQVGTGETIGIVGESGCGKSVLAKSVLGLLPAPPAVYRSGRIAWKSEDLLKATESRLRKVRGAEIGMVFQDPTTFLDPLYTAGHHIVEAIAHQADVRGERMSRVGKRDAALALLKSLNFAEPERVFDSYPHQLSGGMRQRVLIAAAVVGRPRLLIADEPTTALDVTVQAQILRLLLSLVSDSDLSIMLISHDLGVIANVCRRIVVMYAGVIVEDAPKTALLREPAHPYSRGLIDAVPRRGSSRSAFASIPGQIPNLLSPPRGCRFSPRCPRAVGACSTIRPSLRELDAGRRVACHNPYVS